MNQRFDYDILVCLITYLGWDLKKKCKLLQKNNTEQLHSICSFIFVEKYNATWILTLYTIQYHTLLFTPFFRRLNNSSKLLPLLLLILPFLYIKVERRKFNFKSKNTIMSIALAIPVIKLDSFLPFSRGWITQPNYFLYHF